MTFADSAISSTNVYLHKSVQSGHTTLQIKHSGCKCKPQMARLVKEQLEQACNILIDYLITLVPKIIGILAKDIQDRRAGLPQFLAWPEMLISFSLTLSHSVTRHYTSCRGLVLRARKCVPPAVPIRSLVTGRLASGGDRTGNPLRRKRARSHYTTQRTKDILRVI